MAYTQASLIATGVIFPLTGFILVCARFWMRISFQKTYIGIDDWLILAASILVIGMTVDSILASCIGLMGKDDLPIEPSAEIPQKKIDFATLAFEKPAFGAIKLSVLFFYRRIFTLQAFRRVNDALIALIASWSLAFFFADVFSCGVHPEVTWAGSKADKAKYCINVSVMLLCFAVTDVLTDVAVLWMPYPQIRRLQVTSREKWILTGVFALGLLDLGIGVVRFGFIVATQTIPAVNTDFNPPDQTAPTFWTVVEVGVGVIAANLPALAPLYRSRDVLYASLRRKFTLSKTGASETKASVVREEVEVAQSPSCETPQVGCDEGGVLEKQKQKSRVSGHVGLWNQYERMN